MQVNLKKGTITVPPGEGEVVHNICLAFVTATLYLLVQPRPRIIEKVWARARARERVRKIVRARAGEPARTRARTVEMARARTRERARAWARERARPRERARAKTI